MNIHQVLTKYWGYIKFRPLQEEIIYSVLDGKDTLALLPTGGGKSVCFQVPALMKEGICIVISPLISLMKDQVESLNKKGINAVAVYSGMTKREIDITLDNCIYGNYKFLYISPERLSTDILKARIEKMNVNLIAVDEAHCISQWGYDFRPSYLNIVDIRNIVPKVPVLALTATATREVAKDIQEKLEFKQANILHTSFERKNLIYVVLNEEDKLGRLLRILKKLKGSGIIYVRNRKKTKEISDYLNKNKIKSDYYHAGIDTQTRSAKQDNWMNGRVQIIVATNAFGMGIDKSNVRFVIHINTPDSIEAYFQEAGRAGRDENKAYAILLYNEKDKLDALNKINISFPEPEEIVNTYQALSNYYKLAIGSGEGISFDFDIHDFCNTYNIDSLTAYNSIRILEREGLVATNDAVHIPSRIHFEVNKDYLYDYQVRNKYLDMFIKLILRNYSGVFDDFVKINEKYLANKSGVNVDIIIKAFQKLDRNKILTYVPQTSLPQITFTKPRVDVKHLAIDKQSLNERKEIYFKRLNSIIKYASSNNKCRSEQLLAYFGETDTKRCGKCDVCLERNKLELSKYKFDLILEQLKKLLKEAPMPLEDVVKNIDAPEDKILKVIQWLEDNEKIYYDDTKNLYWWDK